MFNLLPHQRNLTTYGFGRCTKKDDKSKKDDKKNICLFC